MVRRSRPPETRMADLTLYHNDMSVCAAKVRMALAEKHVDWEGVHLNLRAGDTHAPQYMALNPHQLVPTLVHKGRVLIESNIICEYVDDAWPDPPLRPADPYERARMRLLMKQLDDGVHGAAGTISLCIAFRHQHLRRKPEDVKRYSDGLVDPLRRERLKQALEQGVYAPAFAPALRRMAKLVADLDAALQDRAWLAADTFSLADIAYAPYMIRLYHLGLDTAMIAPRPKLAAWAGRLFARAAYKEGIERWFDQDALALLAENREVARDALARLAG
jgi:glutathione S-transferase